MIVFLQESLNQLNGRIYHMLLEGFIRLLEQKNLLRTFIENNFYQSFDLFSKLLQLIVR